MVEGMLTQEEIDALLSGTSFGEPSPTQGAPKTVAAAAAPRPVGAALGPDQVKSLDNKLRSALGPAADVASTLIGRNLTLAPVSITPADDATISNAAGSPFAAFEFALTGTISGSAAFVLSSSDAAVFADIMMGGDGSKPPADLDDLHQTAAKEALTSLANGLASALARDAGGNISAGPLSVKMDSAPLADRSSRTLAAYSFTIEGAKTGTIHLVLDGAAGVAIAGESRVAHQTVTAGPPSSGGGTAGPRNIAIQQVQFPLLTPVLTDNQAKNIDILMDVPMQVTVELGRTTMMIRDVLELGTGSIIELDKLAGEPVDLLVNQKLIARGEVVVIDESFGVRVTDIVSPMERVKSLQ